MHLLELRGRLESFLVAIVQLDVEFDLELFEKPEQALGARMVEPGQKIGLG